MSGRKKAFARLCSVAVRSKSPFQKTEPRTQCTKAQSTYFCADKIFAVEDIFDVFNIFARRADNGEF